MNRRSPFLLTVTVCLAAVQTCIAQYPDPNSPHVKTLRAFVQLLERRNLDVDAEANQILVEDALDQLKQKVIDIRKRVARNDSVDVSLESETTGRLDYRVAGETISVGFEMTAQAPVRIKQITVSVDDEKSKSPSGVADSITWQNLESKMDEYARDGFEGAVLVTRDGETVLHKAYGFANREQKIKNSTDTVFATGSQPIDFTHVAILQLKDRGKLSLDDPITKFLDNVPADKKSITIRHLMTGASGFPDFHDLPTDKDKDHSWIDRDEAVNRMLAHKLLFEPGTGRKHSHSAWGMLAAIVEIASGEAYLDFTQKHQFEPARMTDTGFFGERVAEEEIAVGYGELKAGEPNSPPHWGKTSWLVMGSGGQVSTLKDLLKWERAAKDGKFLSPESTRMFLQQHNGLALDGNMYGFEFVHSYDPDSLFMLISNAIDSRDKRRKFMQIGRQLEGLIRGEGGDADRGERKATKFSLGIQMSVDDEGQVFISDVIPGSAAEKDGLQVDDRIISADGQPIKGDPLAVLGPSLQSGRTIRFVVARAGDRVNVSVKPLPRK